jgi:hypothetical protein
MGEVGLKAGPELVPVREVACEDGNPDKSLSEIASSVSVGKSREIWPVWVFT